MDSKIISLRLIFAAMLPFSFVTDHSFTHLIFIRPADVQYFIVHHLDTFIAVLYDTILIHDKRFMNLYEVRRQFVQNIL